MENKLITKMNEENVENKLGTKVEEVSKRRESWECLNVAVVENRFEKGMARNGFLIFS